MILPYDCSASGRPLPKDVQHFVITTLMTDFEGTEVAPISEIPLEQMDSSEATIRRHDEFFFEVASLGPGDLLSRCREGPGNWWGEEECLRVDEQGHVVLMDSTVYFQVRVLLFEYDRHLLIGLSRGSTMPLGPLRKLR